MIKKIAIVTGADKKYFSFLKNLIFSLKKSQSLNICDLCILTVDEDNSYIKRGTTYPKYTSLLSAW